MALQLASPGEEPLIDAHLYILSEYLLPDTHTATADATRRLLDAFPDQSVSSVTDFLDACYDAAGQIPYTHPSQSKLVTLIYSFLSSDKMLNADGSSVFQDI